MASEHEKNYNNVIKFHVQNGANIHVFDDHPLKMASIFGNKEIVKFLIDQYQDTDEAYKIVKKYGNTDIQKYLKAATVD